MAEDAPLNLEIAEELLALGGAEVETATNGREALDAFASSPAGHFDAVLMDVQMPVMDGYTATEALRALADAGRCAWRAKAYDAADLSGADIVFVATDDEDVNARAYRDASGAHLMVNVADRPELCTFFLPSVLRRGKLSIAVSTEGASPLTARRLRRELEERIPAGFETYLDLLAAWRPRAIAALPDEPARLRFWQQATDGRVQRLVQAADEEAAERLLEELLEAERTACATL